MMRAGIAVVLALCATGCSNGVAWNSPFQKATAEDTARRSALRGYTEMRKGDAILVASTYEGIKRVMVRSQ